jgi:hypothetical protein
MNDGVENDFGIGRGVLALLRELPNPCNETAVALLETRWRIADHLLCALAALNRS